MHIDDMVEHADKFQVSKLHRFHAAFVSKDCSAWQHYSTSACHCSARHCVCLVWYVCAQSMLLFWIAMLHSSMVPPSLQLAWKLVQGRTYIRRVLWVFAE